MVMCISPWKGNLLGASVTGFNPLLGLENAVVRVVLIDSHNYVRNITFPHLLTSQGLLCWCRILRVYVLKLDSWSTYIVAYCHIFVVRNLFIWAISPVVGDLRWSTDTTSLGISGSSASSIFFFERCLNGTVFIIAYIHDEQTGITHFASLLRSIPCYIIFCSLKSAQIYGGTSIVLTLY